MAQFGLVDIEDAGELVAYLRRSGRIVPAEAPRVRVLAGGVSNKTVLVERPSGEAWVLKQALPKLRTQAEWFSDPSRICREAEALRWLPRFAPPGTITPLVFEDANQFLLAMEAVPQPHENWKTVLLAGRVEDDHVLQFGRLLARVHAGSAGDAELATAFDDRSFFESLRVEPYYAYTAAQVPAAGKFLNNLTAETRACRLTLVHGDYSPKNVLVHAGRLVLLDHEVVHYGDPAFDPGFALTHMLSKAHHLPAHRERFARAVMLFWAEYLAAGAYTASWAPGLEARVVRHALGCLLARVAGRSPLEYLDDRQRGRQRHAVVELITANDVPATVSDLSSRFLSRL